MIRVGRTALVLVTLLVLQVGLFSDVRVLGVAPDLLLLAAVAAGLTAGAGEGATVGFVAGLLIDVWLPTPFGLSALAYCLAGYGAGWLVDTGGRAEGLLAVGYCVAGSAAGVATFASVGHLLGQAGLWTGDLVRIVAVSALLNGLFAPLVLAASRWSLDGRDRARPDTRLRVLN